MAGHRSARQAALRAIVDHRGEWHGRGKHSRAGLSLHVRSVGSKASACLRLHAFPSSMFRVELEGTAGGIARRRRDKLDFWYAELDFLGRRRVAISRGFVVEGKGSRVTSAVDERMKERREHQ